jgi:hypothetical protein
VKSAAKRAAVEPAATTAAEASSPATMETPAAASESTTAVGRRNHGRRSQAERRAEQSRHGWMKQTFHLEPRQSVRAFNVRAAVRLRRRDTSVNARGIQSVSSAFRLRALRQQRGDVHGAPQ